MSHRVNLFIKASLSKIYLSLKFWDSLRQNKLFAQITSLCLAVKSSLFNSGVAGIIPDESEMTSI